jgi:glutamine amidotransferase
MTSAPTTRSVVVLDYGFGNVRSAERALARAGARVEITADYDKAMNADGLLVPGVGAFAACMAGLRGVRGDWIIGRRLAGGRPVLGICVGMQILFSRGIEHGVRTEGLDEWPGTVEPLRAPVVPHMGWNTVKVPADSAQFAGLDDDAPPPHRIPPAAAHPACRADRPTALPRLPPPRTGPRTRTR